MPTPEKGKLARVFIARTLAALSAIGMLVTCIFLLIKGKAEVAPYPAICSGVLGYLLLLPGKRSVRISMGGMVMDVISDDTGAFKTGVDAVVSSVSHEISERTIKEAIRLSEVPPIPEQVK